MFFFATIFEKSGHYRKREALCLAKMKRTKVLHGKKFIHRGVACKGKDH